MKILTFGDIHTNHQRIDEAKKYINDVDKIVFLGDYVDDFDVHPIMSLITLEKLISLKKEFPDKVVLLYGNHDMSYKYVSMRCSGWNSITEGFTKPVYENNKDLFDYFFVCDKWIWSHAGVTQSWFDKFMDPKKSFQDNIEDMTWNYFNEAGQARGGGSDYPSPVWSDKSELLADQLINPHFNQIVGHTPQLTIHSVEEDSFPVLIFCDTIRGDKSILYWEDGEYRRIAHGKEL